MTAPRHRAGDSRREAEEESMIEYLMSIFDEHVTVSDVVWLIMLYRVVLKAGVEPLTRSLFGWD